MAWRTGPNEPSDIAPALEILADELLYGDIVGWQIDHDASNPAALPFRCHARLLQHHADYMGMFKMLNTTRAPAKTGACYKCACLGVFLRAINKMVYPGVVPSSAIASAIFSPVTVLQNAVLEQSFNITWWGLVQELGALCRWLKWHCGHAAVYSIA